jgi:amidase
MIQVETLKSGVSTLIHTKIKIMKPLYLRPILLFISMILCTVTCKTPVNKTAQKVIDNTWVEEMTIQQLQQGYKEGKYTVRDIVKVYMDRINELDKNGPRLNSIIVVNPDALLIA